MARNITAIKKFAKIKTVLADLLGNMPRRFIYAKMIYWGKSTLYSPINRLGNAQNETAVKHAARVKNVAYLIKFLVKKLLKTLL